MITGIYFPGIRGELAQRSHTRQITKFWNKEAVTSSLQVLGRAQLWFKSILLTRNSSAHNISPLLSGPLYIFPSSPPRSWAVPEASQSESCKGELKLTVIKQNIWSFISQCIVCVPVESMALSSLEIGAFSYYHNLNKQLQKGLKGKRDFWWGIQFFEFWLRFDYDSDCCYYCY